MSYKRVVEKNGKVYGPYVYESYRDKDGNVRKRYLGKKEDLKKKSFVGFFLFGFFLFVFLTGIGYTTDFVFNDGKFFGKFTGFVAQEVLDDSSDSSAEEVIDSSAEEVVDSPAEEVVDSPAEEVLQEVVEDSSSEVLDPGSSGDESFVEEVLDEEVLINDSQDFIAADLDEADLDNGVLVNETFDNDSSFYLDNFTNETFGEVSNFSNNTFLEDEAFNETFDNETISNETLKNETISNETLKNETISNETLKNETISNETLVNETIVFENQSIEDLVEDHLVQYKAVVGRPVKWIKDVNVSVEGEIVLLPKGAGNISVLTGEEIKEAKKDVKEFEKLVDKVDRKKMKEGVVLTGNVVYDLDSEKGFVTLFWEWVVGFGITGNVVLEEEIGDNIIEGEDEVLVDLGGVVDSSEEVAVEYYTPAPEVIETNLSRGKRVIVYSEEEYNYTDILAYALVEEKVPMDFVKEKIKIYWHSKPEGLGVGSGEEVVGSELVGTNELVVGSNDSVAEENDSLIDGNESLVGNVSIGQGEQDVFEENVSVEENVTLVENVSIEEAVSNLSVTSFLTGQVVLGEELNISNESFVGSNESLVNGSDLAVFVNDSLVGDAEGYSLVEVDYVAYDFDNDSFVDYIEWNVEHLSNQTYDIIYIVRAEHLDSNRSFVSDIYEEVRYLDGNWSEAILEGEYVRVGFEIPLDSSRDITLFARSNNEGIGARIEVYEVGSNESVAVFENVSSEGWYKVYLDSLNGTEDVFDLRIVCFGNFSNESCGVEFDYIVDPSFLQITSPTSRYPLTVTSGDVLPITFNFLQDSSNWTSGINIDGVEIGGQVASVVEAVYDDCNSGSFDTAKWTYQHSGDSDGAVDASSNSYYLIKDEAGNGAEMTIHTKDVQNFTKATLSVQMRTTVGDGRGWHVGIGTGALYDQDYCETNTGWSPTDGYAWCYTNTAKSKLVRLDAGVATTLDTDTGSLATATLYNLTFETNSSGVFFFVDGSLLLSSTDTTYSEGGYLTASTGGGSSNLGVLRVYDVWDELPHEFVDGVGWMVNYTVPSLAEGAYDLFVNATGNGNNSGDTEIGAVYVDSLGPTIEFVSPTTLNGSGISGGVDVNLSVVENGNHSVFVDLNRSLVGWWRMDDYNATGVFDNSSWGNFGVFGGGLGVSNISYGARGVGLDFDGVNDYVQISNSDEIETPDSLTWAFWFNCATQNQASTYPRMLDIGDNSVCFPQSAGTTLRFWLNNGVRSSELQYANACDSTWKHFAGTWDGETISLYINGEFQSSTAMSGTLNSDGQVLNIGRDSSNYYYDGLMDEVMVFNRALSEMEILALYDGGSNRIDGFVEGDIGDGECSFKGYVTDFAGNVNSTEQRNVTGYAIGNITTKRFNIDNSSGSSVAVFDENGSAFLKGSVYSNQGNLTPPANSFVVRNLTGVIAYVNESGDLFLSGGSFVGSNLSGRTYSNFEFRNSSGDLVSFFDNQGNLRLKGVLARGYFG